MRGRSLAERRSADHHAGVLVPRLPVPGRRQRNGWRLLSHRYLHGRGYDERLLERGGQRQSDAPPVLPALWHTTVQRGRGSTAPDLRSGWNVRRSGAREAGAEHLDVERANVGLHRRRRAARGTAATARCIAVSRPHAATAAATARNRSLHGHNGIGERARGTVAESHSRRIPKGDRLTSRPFPRCPRCSDSAGIAAFTPV